MTPLTLRAAGSAQAAGKHSAQVTDWSGRIGWIVGLALVVALVYWLMRQGWQWRRTLQGGLPQLPQAPEPVGEPLLSLTGRYHGSTTAGRWLDRIVAHGLGVRSRVTLTLEEQGLDVDRTGAPDFWVPAAALRGARLDKGIAGKVLTEGGLLVVTWEHGGVLIDSGFRSDHAADHLAWVEQVNRLSGDRAVRFTDQHPDRHPDQASDQHPGQASDQHPDPDQHPEQDPDPDRQLVRHDKEGAQ